MEELFNWNADKISSNKNAPNRATLSYTLRLDRNIPNNSCDKQYAAAFLSMQQSQHLNEPDVQTTSKCQSILVNRLLPAPLPLPLGGKERPTGVTEVVRAK